MQVLGNSDGVEAPRAHAQRKKPLPEPGVVREGFLEEEKLKPAGVRVEGWRRAPAVPQSGVPRGRPGGGRCSLRSLGCRPPGTSLYLGDECGLRVHCAGTVSHSGHPAASGQLGRGTLVVHKAVRRRSYGWGRGRPGAGRGGPSPRVQGFCRRGTAGAKPLPRGEGCWERSRSISESHMAGASKAESGQETRLAGGQSRTPRPGRLRGHLV